MSRGDGGGEGLWTCPSTFLIRVCLYAHSSTAALCPVVLVRPGHTHSAAMDVPAGTTVCQVEVVDRGRAQLPLRLQLPRARDAPQASRAPLGGFTMRFVGALPALPV